MLQNEIIQFILQTALKLLLKANMINIQEQPKYNYFTAKQQYLLIHLQIVYDMIIPNMTHDSMTSANAQQRRPRVALGYVVLGIIQLRIEHIMRVYACVCMQAHAFVRMHMHLNANLMLTSYHKITKNFNSIS